jgi:hypothetical protein
MRRTLVIATMLLAFLPALPARAGFIDGNDTPVRGTRST